MTSITRTVARVRGHSTPIDLPRLGLASLSFTIPSLHNGSDQTLCFSGHGSFIEIYSNFKHSWQLVEALDAFPETKCTVNGLFPFRLNERECLLLCFGQNEFAFFTATQFKDDQMGGVLEESRWNWKRVKGGSLSDWILNAKILFGRDGNEEGACLKAGIRVVLHFANNWIRVLELFGDRTDETAAKPFEVLSLRLGCPALVTSSFLHGDHLTSLRVFACTSFGAIHLFQPAIGPQILRTFFGNVGMSFAIRSDSNLWWLFSIGDDRSLRIWNVQNGAKLFTKFGHGARPFALELSEGKRMIFTGGMDNYICIWRWSSEEKSSCVEMNGLFLERKVDICWATGGGGTIRSILALECDRQVPKGPFDLLVGSERGSLFAVSLSADLQPLSCPIEAKKVNAFAFIRIRGILCLISLDKKRMFVIERIDSRTDVDAGEESDLAEHFRVNFSDCNGRPMVFRPDMFYYSDSARSLALCTESDRSLHLAIFGNRSFCSTHHIIGAPIDQFLWVQPESCQLFLTIDQNGQVTVYRIGESSDENDSHRSLLTVSQFLLSNNKCDNEDENKVAKVQVALLIAETSADVPTVGVLLLGTRSGTLMAFSLQSGQLLLLNRLAHGTNGCAKTVTALHIEAIQNSKKTQIEGNLISMGRDGTLKKWHFHWEQKRSLENVVEKFSLDSFFVRQLPVEWPCAIVPSDNSRAFIVGFHSNEFVMMDFESLFILSTFRCGGGNRKWQFIVGTEGKETDRTYSFAYICKGFLNFVLLDPVEFHPIRSSLHSDNIVTMTSLEHRGTVFLISGGTDRRLALSLFKPSDGKRLNKLSEKTSYAKQFVPLVRCVDSSNVHRSNLECIYVVDTWHLHDETNGSGRDKDDRLILSVGGRSEICAWKLHFDADNETTDEVLPQLHFLSSIDLSDDSVRSSDGPSPQDCRLMAVRLLSDQFLAILCSDGTIRIVQFHRRFHHSPISPRPNNWTIRLHSLAMFTSLELIEHNKVLFCTSTDGHLHAFAISVPMLQQDNVDFDAEASFEESAHFCQQPFSSFLVEHCGLSALTIAPFSEYDVIFIGSESGRVNVLKHRSNRGTCQNEAMVELVTRGDWHASTVTALQTVTCPFPSSSQCPTLITVLSTSLDCRLGVVHYDLIRQELRPLRHFPLCVSDPAALLVLPTNSPLELDCFVSGYGIEHLHLNIEHNDEYEKRCAVSL